MSFQTWNKNPIWSPKWTLFFFAILGAFFIVFGIVFLGAADTTTEIAVDFRPGGKCADKIAATTGAITVESEACEENTTGNMNAKMVESLTFKVTAAMAKPINMYVEIDGMFQNHRRWVRSVSNNAPVVIQRAGNKFDYHQEQTGYVENDGQDYQSAIYRFWHPAHVQSMRSGCFPWFAEGNVEDCTTDLINSCKKGPEDGYRVYYPCGLGARAAYTDTFALSKGTTAIALDETHEKITFKNDYVNRFNNLDPEGIFHCDASKKCDGMPGANVADCKAAGTRGHMADTISKMTENDCKKLDGLQFQDVLSMHLLWNPAAAMLPSVCADDPLKITKIKHKAGTGGKAFQSFPFFGDDVTTPTEAGVPQVPDCTLYKDFSYTASKNKATCSYDIKTTATENPKNPITGQRIACASQIPNSAGWGLENTHYINWARLSGTTNFRKMYSVIDEDWAVGDEITLHVANRYDLLEIGGKDNKMTKRIVFTTASTIGGKHEYIGLTFLISGVVCLTFFVFVLLQHLKDPRKIDKIEFMDWADKRKKVAEKKD